MADIVLMGDPRVAGIPVAGHDDPLVDVAAGGVVRLDERYRDDTGDWRLLRAGVLARLEAAAALLPDGLALLHVEGYRSPARQRAYFTEYRDELAAADPGRDDAELDRLASRYIAPPAVAPHTAGAAVDLTLCTADGVELDLGTRVNATPEESDGRCYTAAAGLGAQAQAHRHLLARVLGEAGLVNYPTEWWHWSYGDRYWALATGAHAALYGPLDR